MRKITAEGLHSRDYPHTYPAWKVPVDKPLFGTPNYKQYHGKSMIATSVETLEVRTVMSSMMTFSNWITLSKGRYEKSQEIKNELPSMILSIYYQRAL